ncbi:gliding motility protein RemB [Christiangramia sp. SM2212]|uniref:Gliding motility protein RemB n=1 Tax=Christiangramia sediminicola TaxID=3073267 RepID=A0ABU1ELW9_9FLAO|nr:gliding motility protein RemB [Christiangramia sp. SM2212]MDR5589383.1 gliding motility protein RemB [Christiangramia sp. SM2212]
MKYILLLPLLLFSFQISAQDVNLSSEIYPEFEECASVDYSSQEYCFNSTLVNFIKSNFEVPEIVQNENYKGQLTIIFEVDETGKFQLIYMDAAYDELKTETQRVFEALPEIKPATYNGRPVHMQFKMPLKIPLQNNVVVEPVGEEDEIQLRDDVEVEDKEEPNALSEYERIKSDEFTSPRYTSQISIPLSHEFYSRFDAAFNEIGTNTHSASKPLMFAEVNPYYDFKANRDELLQDRNSLAGRKLWNEHLIRFQTEKYWFTLDPGFDLQIGKDFEQTEHDFTYNNTRELIIQGGLGKKFNFYSVIYENQGRFAQYYNNYAESIRPAGGDPAIVPGRGIAKTFMDDGYDYPVAEGYLSFTPSEFINIQFGHGNNFIGDGYRSLLLSDNPTPHPYLKLNTKFWKIKYTNTWMSLRDVRPEVVNSGSFRTKYIANHYLSLNISKRLNLGFFESVMWENDNDRGFDLNYLNPVIFYRAIEFATGADGGNAIIGLTGKYKFSNQMYAYGQWLIDEFSSTDVFGGDGSWKNKLGFQAGLKYFNAFGVDDLYLQAEYNQVRPYTYSHNSITLNYGHNNQSMAHLWGANFREIIGVARYRKDRWYGSAKLIYGKRGFDFSETGDYYGQDIYRTEEDRPFDSGVKIGQGNTTNSFYSELEAGYLVNPTTNLKLFASFIYRDFNPQAKTVTNFENSTTWINFGLRTDIFNWYFDY